MFTLWKWKHTVIFSPFALDQPNTLITMFSHQWCAVEPCIYVKGWTARNTEGCQRAPFPRRCLLAANKGCVWISCSLVPPLGEGLQVTCYNTDSLCKGHTLCVSDRQQQCISQVRTSKTLREWAMSQVHSPARELRSTKRSVLMFRKGKGGVLQTGSSAARSRGKHETLGMVRMNPGERGKVYIYYPEHVIGRLITHINFAFSPQGLLLKIQGWGVWNSRTETQFCAIPSISQKAIKSL